MTDPADPPNTADSQPSDESLFQALKSWLTRRRPRNGEGLRGSIEEIIQEHGAAEETAVEPGELALLRNILTLHDKAVEDVMVPRADIVAVEIETSLPDLVKVMTERPHSRLPVYRGDLDDVQGMVHIKDVMTFWGRGRSFNLSKAIRPVLFVAPSMAVVDLLAQMRDTRRHLALVVDEFGGIDGLVTIEDLVEEIVGEIEDEHDVEETPEMTEGRGGVLTADARVTVEDFEARCGTILTEEEREDVDTLGGLVFQLAGRVPSRGELILHPSGVEFEVVEADPRRIRRLRVRNLPAPDEASA